MPMVVWAESAIVVTFKPAASHEHRRLKELALARDADGAIEVLTEHIERAPREVIAYAKEHGVDCFG